MRRRRRGLQLIRVGVKTLFPQRLQPAIDHVKLELKVLDTLPPDAVADHHVTHSYLHDRSGSDQQVGLTGPPPTLVHWHELASARGRGEPLLKQAVQRDSSGSQDQGVRHPVQLDVFQPSRTHQVVVVLQRDPGFLRHGTNLRIETILLLNVTISVPPQPNHALASNKVRRSRVARPVPDNGRQPGLPSANVRAVGWTRTGATTYRRARANHALAQDP
jgi:hypothetical protein